MVKKEPKKIVLELKRSDLKKLRKKWPWKSKSVDEVTASHLIQYLKPSERIHFMNELHRILKAECKATIIVPHWASCRAYGDIDAEWPPVSELWLFYLKKEWREINIPKEKRYKCDFDATWGYGMHQSIANRTQEYQQHAITFWKEAAQDLMATLIKR